MRIDIRKTYKLYIGGAFPRSESGRTYEVTDAKSNFIANPAQASRKDLRDAVTAARSAFGGWSGATAFNRSQILYRIAEMMEARSEEFVEEIALLEGISRVAAKKEVDQAIDTWVWYCGWCDKISTVAGSTNPISGPFYNFTVPESLGVVGVFPAQKSALLGLVQAIAPVIAGGNTAVVVASQKFPLCAVTLSEALATSDLPGGVVNILTGITSELAPWMGAHMDVDAIDATGLSKELDKEVRVSGADNLKRIHKFSSSDTPQRMLAFMEYKTVWHPIGI